jgi:hypothetical protein
VEVKFVDEACVQCLLDDTCAAHDVDVPFACDRLRLRDGALDAVSNEGEGRRAPDDHIVWSVGQHEDRLLVEPIVAPSNR